LIQSIHGTGFHLPESHLETLLDACRYHNDGLTSTDLTIGTCWDADRMDLLRVGIVPNPEKMSTIHGKDYATRGPVALKPARPNGHRTNG
jgi:uncharacterized protein